MGLLGLQWEEDQFFFYSNMIVFKKSFKVLLWFPVEGWSNNGEGRGGSNLYIGIYWEKIFENLILQKLIGQKSWNIYGSILR